MLNINIRRFLYWGKTIKWVRTSYHRVAWRLDKCIFKHLPRYEQWHNSRFYKYIHLALGGVVGVGVVLIIASALHQAYALSTWTQTDWSGGVGTSTTNQYSSTAGIDPVGTPGQLNLPNSLTYDSNEITDATRTTNTQGDGIAPPDSSTGIWGATTNMLLNGGAETNLTDITNPNSGTTITRDTTTSKFGSASAKVVTDGTIANQGVYWHSGAGPSSTRITVSASTTYTFSVWAKGNLGTEVMYPVITWYDSTNTQISTSPGSIVTLGTGWNYYTVTATSPSNAAYATGAFRINGTTADTFWADGAQFEKQTMATPYVETHGATATRNAADLQAPAGTLSGTQGWVAMRMRMGGAPSSYNSLYAAQPPRLFGWGTSYQDFEVSVNTTYNGTIGFARDSARTGGGSVFSSPAWSTAGSLVTVVFAWTANNIYISTNGSAFTSNTATGIPPSLPSTFYIGSYLSGSDPIDADVMWTAAGTGTLSNSDASTLNSYGNTDPTLSNLQTLNNGAASPTIAWDGTSTTYATSGTLTSSIYDGSVPNNWGTLSYTANTPAGTSVSIEVRGGNQPNLSDAPPFSSCSPISNGSSATNSCLPTKSRYVQYQVTLNGTSTATPNLQDISINYTPSDIIPPPTNASNIAMYQSNGGASVASDSWTNADPYFTWTAGADDVGGSGILGYCLYLGQDPTGDPVTTKGDLGTSPVNTNGACQFAVSSTNIDTSISGYIATALTTSSSPYYLNIKAIDNGDNVYTGSSTQFEFMYDNTPPTNPAFISAPSEFVSNKQVTLTWPTTGGDAAADDTSGVAGLQYRIGSSGTWYGVNHNNNQDASDLLPNNGSYTTISDPDFVNLVEGNNIIYFRTWDNAGNISTAYVTTVVKINTTSPSSPQNLTATPTSNTTNSFGFSWIPPATYTGSASNITYCYTINVLPTSSNCTYTAPGQTSLDAGAYATEPGDNTFYVVAKDEAGNINYATAASTTFTANTTAPGVPLNIDIADISVKVTSNWKLALSWETPTDVGAGVSTYKVFRSTNDNTFTDIASTAGASYVDSSLSQQTYYYKVQACDSANNCGGFTDVVSLMPTGKFTSPANLISGPTVSTTTRTATINWTTDRGSDSSVEYGLSSGNYFATEAANTSQVTSHTISLDSLTAGTTYYYRAQWTDEDGNIGTSAEGVFTTQPAPTVSNVTTGNINLTTATIQFTSSNATAIDLVYGGGALSSSQTQNTSTNTSTYSIPLTGLSPGTTYTFRLNLVDTSGNVYENPTTFSFSTPPQPQITNIEFQPVPGALTGTEQVSWTTNVPATSDISYGQPGQAQLEAIDSTLVTNHTMTIANMPYNTPYNLIARSTDQLGNTAVSDLQVFHTGLDTRPPIISDVTIQPSIRGTGASAQGQLVISWKTDKSGTSQVAYGQGSGGNYSSKTAEDTTLVNNHVVVVSNLSTSEVYHLQVLSKDADGIQGVSPDQTTIIGQASDNALSIVFNALQSIFGL